MKILVGQKCEIVVGFCASDSTCFVDIALN
jgi:hypothetical protein